MPLYADGIPSHVLPFLQKMEKAHGQGKNIYVIANNGFIEGKQNEPLMQMMENFCHHSGFTWKGGLGIGGGVMMNVMRILILVFAAMLIFEFLLAGIRDANFLPLWPLTNFGSRILWPLFFSSGILISDIKMAICISRMTVW